MVAQSPSPLSASTRTSSFGRKAQARWTATTPSSSRRTPQFAKRKTAKYVTAASTAQTSASLKRPVSLLSVSYAKCASVTQKNSKNTKKAKSLPLNSSALVTSSTLLVSQKVAASPV